MLAVPHEILREIGKYWAGHGIHYTCRALYTSWNPNNYLVTESNEFAKIMATYGDAISNITINRMPNGVHHGESVATSYYIRNGSMSTEIIEYDRGVLLSMTYQRPQHYSRDIVIDNRVATWTSVASNDPAITPDCLGTVMIDYNRSCDDVPFCDFVAVACEIIAHAPTKKATKIELMLDWDWQMPGTRQ